MHILDLNDDVLSHIFTFINEDEHVFSKYTCKVFFNIFNNRITKINDSIIFRHIKYLEWAIENGYRIKKKYMFTKAIVFGNTDVLNCLYDMYDNKYMTPYHYELCLELGYISKFMTLYEMRCPYNEDLYMNIICNYRLKSLINNYFEFCNWVRENYIFNDDDLRQHIRENNIEKIVWSLKSIPKLRDYICEISAQENNIEMLKWACDNKLKITKDTFTIAIKKENKQMIELLKNYDCPLNWLVLDTAISYEDYDTVKWLFNKRCDINHWVLTELHKKNRYDILEYLYTDEYYKTQISKLRKYEYI